MIKELLVMLAVAVVVTAPAIALFFVEVRALRRRPTVNNYFTVRDSEDPARQVQRLVSMVTREAKTPRDG